MKKISALILVLVFVVSVAKAGFCEAEIDPQFKASFDKQAAVQKQARAFYRYMQAGDLDNILTLVSLDILEKFSKSNSPEGIGHNLGLAITITSAVKEKAVAIKIADLQVTSAEKQNGVVAVTTTYTATLTAEGKSTTDKVKDVLLFKQEDGKWVIFDMIQ